MTTRETLTPAERARWNEVKRRIYAKEAAKFGCESDLPIRTQSLFVPGSLLTTRLAGALG